LAAYRVASGKFDDAMTLLNQQLGLFFLSSVLPPRGSNGTSLASHAGGTQFESSWLFPLPSPPPHFYVRPTMLSHLCWLLQQWKIEIVLRGNGFRFSDCAIWMEGYSEGKGNHN
jgi:hypothetical protein